VQRIFGSALRVQSPVAPSSRAASRQTLLPSIDPKALYSEWHINAVRPSTAGSTTAAAVDQVSHWLWILGQNFHVKKRFGQIFEAAALAAITPDRLDELFERH
jgi:hypothetical protein